MTDSEASYGSAAKFGESDSVERVVSAPSVEGVLPITDVSSAPVASDDELGGTVLAPSVVSEMISAEMVP